MPRVFIPASLRKLTNDVRSVEVTASTVNDAIHQLDRLFPGLRDRLCDGEQLRAEIVVSVDARISGRGLLEPVSPDSEIHFLPTVGGG